MDRQYERTAMEDVLVTVAIASEFWAWRSRSVSAMSAAAIFGSIFLLDGVCRAGDKKLQEQKK